jgi:hypothetical protein
MLVVIMGLHIGISGCIIGLGILVVLRSLGLKRGVGATWWRLLVDFHSPAPLPCSRLCPRRCLSPARHYKDRIKQIATFHSVEGFWK